MFPILDLALPIFAAAALLGLAGAGVLALPWSEQEVKASWSAWGALGSLVAAVPSRWVRAEPPMLLRFHSPDDLLPEALPRSLPEFSRAQAYGHVARHDPREAWRAPLYR